MYDVDWKREHKQNYIGLQLDALIALVTAQGAIQMSEFSDLKDAVAKLGTDIAADIAAGQGAASDLHTQLDAAKASLDAATASLATVQADDDASKAALASAQASIADLTQQIADAKTAATDATTSINAIDAAANAAAANLKPSV